MAQSAMANGEVAARLLELFERPVGRYLLTTRRGADIMRMLRVSDSPGLARVLAAEESTALREELERQMAKIQGEIDDFRRFKQQTGLEPSPLDGLTKSERALVRTMADRLLRLRDPHWVISHLTPTEIE